MRAPLDAKRLHELMRAIGDAARGPGTVYVCGGASAILVGWRDSTVDADLKLDPEPAGVFASLARLKDDLSVNVELASPADFIPELPGWRERSPLIVRHGQVDFRHLDFASQALAKVERGHARDLADVREMLARGLVAPAALRTAFEAIVQGLDRYPAVDARAFRRKFDAFLAEAGNA